MFIYSHLYTFLGTHTNTHIHICTQAHLWQVSGIEKKNEARETFQLLLLSLKKLLDKSVIPSDSPVLTAKKPLLLRANMNRVS